MTQHHRRDCITRTSTRLFLGLESDWRHSVIYTHLVTSAFTDIFIIILLEARISKPIEYAGRVQFRGVWLSIETELSIYRRGLPNYIAIRNYVVRRGKKMGKKIRRDKCFSDMSFYQPNLYISILDDPCDTAHKRSSVVTIDIGLGGGQLDAR